MRWLLLKNTRRLKGYPFVLQAFSGENEDAVGSRKCRQRDLQFLALRTGSLSTIYSMISKRMRELYDCQLPYL